MTTTSDDAAQRATDTAAEAWMGALRLLAEARPGGFASERAPGTWELVTGAPMPFLNGVIGLAAEPDVDEIAAVAASPRLAEVASSIQVRSARAGEAVAAVAAAHGLGNTMALPFMLKALGEEDCVVPHPDGVVVRPVRSDESERYQAALAEGYEGPYEFFGIFTARSVMDHPSMRAYVAEVDGEVVATSFGVLVADQVGIFNIAVPPPHRRRGYGRAATAAVMRDAYRDGARTAFLHASELGTPLYLDMGFDIAERWTLHVP
jgi:GNAT superfamily N-acetyltransferase